MTRLPIALVTLVLVALSAQAAMAQTNAPPGNSAIDEYLETIPTATGNRPSGKPGSGGGDKTVLTPTQRKRLEALGPDGKALVAAVEATAPPAAAPAATPGAKQTEVSAGEGRSPISTVFEAVTGTDSGAGMGFMFPVILLASLLGVIALVVLRRRSAP